MLSNRKLIGIKELWLKFKNIENGKSLGSKHIHILICNYSSTSKEVKNDANDNDLAKQFVPPNYKILEKNDKENFRNFISKSKRLFVLSGAGISTESGIPDYRSEKVGLYARKNHKPMEISEFLKSSANRQRYWARNYVGWHIFSSFKPNDNHYILSKWESINIHHHVTQNVDSLMIKAGSKKLTELHGSAARVHCFDCNFKISRDAMQLLIQSENKNWTYSTNDKYVTDSDIEVAMQKITEFVLPKCPSCGGDKLKPEIVFFGDNIPKQVNEFINQKLSESDAILVLGSSLQVFSSYRIVSAAHNRGLPIAIVNIGKTRGDCYAKFKFETLCSDLLKTI